MTKILVDEIQAPGGKPFKVSKDGGVLGGAGGAEIVEVTTLPDKFTAGSVGDQVLFDSDIYRYIEENAKGHLWKGITTDYTSQIPPIGEEIFHESGVFTVPSGVEKISVVAVGAGGGGAYTWSNYAGQGGGLAWASNVPVTSGQTINITISGSSTTYSGRTPFNINGGDSVVDGIVTAQGGNYGNNSRGGYTIHTSAPGVTWGGGNGGNNLGQSWQGGGGGAGGYSNDGGNGGYGNGTVGNGGGGGGGGGYPSSTYSFGGGGGVGIFGEGPNGAGGTYTHGNSWDSFPSNYSAGKGGSGGKDGIGQTNSSHGGRDITWPDGNDFGETVQYHGWGGMYGGGGGGAGTSASNGSFGKGGAGVVRIIWGEGRSFPDNAEYVTPVTGA
jgi:hypothetical protein